MVSDPHEYDVAVSFAGAQRAYVEEFVEACKALGIAVFYDRDMAIRYWGRNLIYQFRQVYGGTATRFVMPFFSAEYLATPYPQDELAAAVEQGIHRPGQTYLLPVLLGEVSIPPALLSSAIGHIRADDLTPTELAEMTLQRLRMADAASPGVDLRSSAGGSAAEALVAAGRGQGRPTAAEPAALAGPEPGDPPRPRPVTGPATYAGSGNKILAISKPDDGPVLITTTNRGPSQNFTVVALDADLSEGDLLVNAIGDYTGTSILDRNGGDTRRLKISGGGSWQITLEPLSAARSMTTSVSGVGDDVIAYRGPTGVATVSNRGPEDNFTVFAYGEDGETLVVNEIGTYAGETTIKEGPAYLEVDGGGSWSIEVAP